MQPHAVLINTARGPVLDEAARFAVSCGSRRGLDVCEEEPIAKDVAETGQRVHDAHAGYSDIFDALALFGETVLAGRGFGRRR